MPRQRSGGSARPVFKSNGYIPVRNAPKPGDDVKCAVTPAPPPAPAPAPPPVMGRGGGGSGSSAAEGMGHGGGKAIANRAMDAILGSRVVIIRHESSAKTVPSSLGSNACGFQIKSFQDCVNSSEDDVSKCQFYMDMLSECRKRRPDSVLTA